MSLRYVDSFEDLREHFLELVSWNLNLTVRSNYNIRQTRSKIGSMHEAHKYVDSYSMDDLTMGVLVADEKRKHQPREQRLLSEFLAREYPTTPHMTRVRLGSVVPEEISETSLGRGVHLFRVFKRWADGLILLSDKTIIIEAKIRLEPGVITKLELYHKLFQETPEFKDRWHRPIEEMLVFAVEDPVTIQLAREHKIRAVEFHPPWVDDYLRILHPREREAPLASLKMRQG